MAINMSYKNAPHNKEGEIGENIVLDYLKSKKKIIKINDVRYVEEYQNKDIDFVVKKKVDEWTTNKVKIEVKTDIKAGTYGNLFIEKEIHYLKDTKEAKKGTIKQGWMYYSECDYFFIYVPKHEYIYVFSRETLKKYIDYNFPPVRDCEDGYKTVYGWCVKIKDLIRKYNDKIFVIDSNTFRRVNNEYVIESL